MNLLTVMMAIEYLFPIWRRISSSCRFQTPEWHFTECVLTWAIYDISHMCSRICLLFRVTLDHAQFLIDSCCSFFNFSILCFVEYLSFRSFCHYMYVVPLISTVYLLIFVFANVLHYLHVSIMFFLFYTRNLTWPDNGVKNK